MALLASTSILESIGVQWSGSKPVRGELDAMSSVGFIPPQACYPWRVPEAEVVPLPLAGECVCLVLTLKGGFPLPFIHS